MLLKVMTFNIAGGRDYTNAPDSVVENPEAHARVIAGEAPDIVGLNEVDEGVSRSGGISVSGVIADALGYDRVFAPAIEYGGGLYGNALLTRHKIIRSEVIKIPDVFLKLEPTHYESRCILHAVIRYNEREDVLFDVFVTHFGLAGRERKNAVAALRKLIKKAEYPVILMGDFNLYPDDKTIVPLRRLLKNSGDMLPEGSESFPSHPGVSSGRGGVIDYIFASDGLRCGSVKLIESRVSDHKPYVAVFDY